MIISIATEQAVEQAVRRSHCSRPDKEHPCVGTCTISSAGIELACVLCGALAAQDWLREDLRNTRAIFDAAGMDFDCLSGESQVRAVDMYRQIAAELRKRI